MVTSASKYKPTDAASIQKQVEAARALTMGNGLVHTTGVPRKERERERDGRHENCVESQTISGM